MRLDQRAFFLAFLSQTFSIGCGNGSDYFPAAHPLVVNDGGMGAVAAASGAGGNASAATGGVANTNTGGSNSGSGASTGVASSGTGANSGTGATSGAAGSGALPVCEPTAQSIHDTIIAPTCTTRLCHGSGAAAALDLSTADWSSNLIGVSSSTCEGWARIVPGSPEQSFLYEKVSKDAPACGGERMPSGGVLSDQYIQCIGDWIRSLAQGSCETCGGSTCVSLPTDSNNCGSCNNVCPSGSMCESGACVCQNGQSACGGACVDTATDAANCGTCGNLCATGALCNSGHCACTGSLSACGNGCYDLGSDAAHCGACATACAAGDVCLAGKCSSGCGSLTQCGSSCVDTSSSTTNCGSCGHACAAGLVCSAGVCGCASGTTACGSSCVDLASDRQNCGACGTACGPGSTCASGQCQCGATAVSFQSDVQPIFSASCINAGCHSGARPKEGLSLEPGAAYAALVGAKTTECSNGLLLVKAGDSGQSYLMDKLLGANLCSGSQMPKAGQSLPAADLATISDWICQGAKQN